MAVKDTPVKVETKAAAPVAAPKAKANKAGHEVIGTMKAKIDDLMKEMGTLCYGTGFNPGMKSDAFKKAEEFAGYLAHRLEDAVLETADYQE